MTTTNSDSVVTPDHSTTITVAPIDPSVINRRDPCLSNQ